MCSGPVQCAANGPDRRAVRELDRRDEDVVVAGALDDAGRGPLARGGVADGEGDLGAGRRERAGGLDADTGRAAGDDGPATGQVDAGDHLGGGGVVRERGGDPAHQVCPVLRATL
jgi:hypothetical protein